MNTYELFYLPTYTGRFQSDKLFMLIEIIKQLMFLTQFK